MKSMDQEIYSDVLFQKLGNTWYAFTEVNENLVYSALPEGVNPKSSSFELVEVIDEHVKKVSKIKYKRAPEAAI